MLTLFKDKFLAVYDAKQLYLSQKINIAFYFSLNEVDLMFASAHLIKTADPLQPFFLMQHIQVLKDDNHLRQNVLG